MSKRAITNLFIIAILALAVWGISEWQRASKAGRLVQELMQRDDYEAYRAMRRITGLGHKAIARVVPLLQAEQPYVRARAVMLVGQSGSSKYASAILGLLEDSEAQVRAAAAVALGHLGSPEAVTPLIHLLQDAEQPLEVRTAAAWGLGLLSAPKAVSALAAALDLEATEENAPLRQAAIVALGNIHESEAVTEVVAHLAVPDSEAEAEPDPTVRTLAAESLAQAPKAGEEALAAATRALTQALARDEASEVRIAAAHGLGQMHLPRDLSQQVTSALENAQDDVHYWVRRAAKEALR